MGNQAIVDLIKKYTFLNEKSISKSQFINGVFNPLNNSQNHQMYGKIIITNSEVLQSYYSLLLEQYPSGISKSKLIDAIQKLFQKYESIDESFKIITQNRTNEIHQDTFILFVKKCLNAGLTEIIKESRESNQFKVGLVRWIQENIDNHIKEIFKRVSPGNVVWNLGDFKRWILDQNVNEWCVAIQIKGQLFRIPLNLTCLFGIDLKK